MSATIALKGIAVPRRVDASLSFIQHSLMIVGLMLLLGSFKQWVEANTIGTGEPVVTSEAAAPAEAAADEAAPATQSVLSPRLHRVLDSVSRRYRVAPEALVPVFEAAQRVGGERRLDPLLIIAIIGIESRFNPFAESPVGAKGLMQVIPGYHLDKVPQGSGETPFLDPVTNIQVGVHVLEEAIRWRGSLTAGLQHYGGAPDDPETGYANKVMAEKERLEQAARRGRA
ncbi:MAG TPA: transglycosylase SLT domain-containing protein [Candidatus Accumulibacter phosphatis]|nr:lytic transglycosylase domain-containing protein [Accumulibacter sp.]HCN67041.1 lytic transglycosylase domain-containing protein [Accumulibacter sp.]HCV12315.1 lytic transglycosylase domain-containing protein [Accumulibacter sp.]HRL76004.1 transglycosylase SLT domain-containing protein [Candidatus Accumulibacter phosphatis]HRQ93622.1 transglycosylase SLT domain-containing protein [Candidatus Accumulibacter phosphatis]